MVRTLLTLASILAAALGLVGLTFRASVETPADFRFINGTEPKTLDPGLLTGQPGGRVVSAIFEGLTRFDEATMEPVPGVAESWTVSADGRRYEFTLRPDALWSDGRPVTAHDFVYAWRRTQDPALGSEYAYLFSMIRFAEEFNRGGGIAERLRGAIPEALAALPRTGEGAIEASVWQRFVRDLSVSEAVQGTSERDLLGLLGLREGAVGATALQRFEEALGREAVRRSAAFAEAKRRFGVDGGVFAPGERQLVVELDAPTPYFLPLTAFYPAMPVPRWVVEAEGNARDWFLPGKIVSNGPFVLESWRVNERIRLVRNERYWGRSEVALGVVDVLPVEDETTALNLYLSGQVDWLPSSYPNDLVDPLRARDDFYATPQLAIYYYRINCTKPPLDDVRIRKAISLAIDREEIVRDVLRLGQLPAHHIVPPGMSGYERPPSEIRLDIAEARRLLAEAGHPGGEGLGEIGILYNTNEGHKKVAEVIADQLRRTLGLEVEAYNQEWQSYLQTTRDGAYDMARAGWIGDYEDPNTFLDLWITDGGNNQTGWSHPTFDRLIAGAADIERFLADAGRVDLAYKEPARIRAGIAAVETATGADVRRRAAERLRMELLREAEAVLVADEFPVLPIYFYVTSGLLRPEVEGFYNELTWPDGRRGFNLRGVHPLRGVRIARAVDPAASVSPGGGQGDRSRQSGEGGS